MNSCTNKKYNFPHKNWLSLLNVHEKQRKKTSRPTYSNLYAYAANNPVRYLDPDGRVFEWERNNNGDEFHFETGYSDFVYATPIYKYEIIDYQTYKTDENKFYKYSCSGNKDVISLSNGTLFSNVTITGTLKRFNITLDGKHYDVISFIGTIESHFLFSKGSIPLSFSLACEDLDDNNYSIYEGIFYRNNFIDVLKEISDNVLYFQGLKIISFIPNIDPITGNITDSLIDTFTETYIDHAQSLFNINAETITNRYLNEIINQE